MTNRGGESRGSSGQAPTPSPEVQDKFWTGTVSAFEAKYGTGTVSAFEARYGTGTVSAFEARYGTGQVRDRHRLRLREAKYGTGTDSEP